MMEELEIRQKVVTLHNDLRAVNMPDQYKSLFVSILMLDEVEIARKKRYRSAYCGYFRCH